MSRITIDQGALQMALNVLSRAGKDEIAAELANSADADELAKLREERDALAATVERLLSALSLSPDTTHVAYAASIVSAVLDAQDPAAILAARDERIAAPLQGQIDALSATINKIADVFLIGAEARTPMTILENVSNATRRSACLSGIESFHVTTEEDEDGFLIYEQLLNWGECPKQYLETYKAVVAARDERVRSEALREAPTVEDAAKMGYEGGEAAEAERVAFEAWMRGHCWVVIGDWDGKTYVHQLELGGTVVQGALRTRQLWAAWRDRAALNRQMADAIEKGGLPKTSREQSRYDPTGLRKTKGGA